MARAQQRATVLIQRLRRKLNFRTKRELRLRVNRVLRALDAEGKNFGTYVAQEAIGKSGRPRGTGWNDVSWPRLTQRWREEKLYNPESVFQNIEDAGAYFLNTGTLRASFQQLRVGRALGLSYVTINGVKPTSRTNWSNIKVDLRRPISIRYFPFRNVSKDLLRPNRTGVFNLLKSQFGNVAYPIPGRAGHRLVNAANLLMSNKSNYRPLVEPALVYFMEERMKRVLRSNLKAQSL